MKKNYIKPSIIEFRFEGQPILTGSQLDSSKDNPDVKPTDEEISGGFGSRRHRDDWDEEEEDF